MKPRFDYSLDFRSLDFRKHPERYVVGKGEQGVLSVEPYKSEILPHWRFRTPDIACASAKKIYRMFLHYLKEEDFVGADMARKFLQMGYTRARRYANHASGRKYDSDGSVLTDKIDPVKAESARVFYPYWRKAAAHKRYVAMKKAWEERE